MKTALADLWFDARRSLGAVEVLGAVLLVAAMAAVAWTAHLREEARALRNAGDARHAQARAAKPSRLPPREHTLDSQVAEFVAALPPMSRNPDDMALVFSAAKRVNIQLTQGDYSVKRETHSPFVALTATFPVHADYGALKQFSAELLQAAPHLAIDELRMTRTNAGNSAIEAVVRFTFFYRRA